MVRRCRKSGSCRSRRSRPTTWTSTSIPRCRRFFIRCADARRCRGTLRNGEVNRSLVAHPIGANTWIWTSPLTDERLVDLAPRIRGWGFDVIELPIENLGDWDPGRTRELLQRLGLGATTCLVMPPGRD